MTSSSNILFIAVDDLFDFTAFRNSFGVEIQTPNLDAVLEDSIQFKHAYATIPMCNPSRAATMTGHTGFESGVLDLEQPWYEVMDPNDSFPALLKQAGYHNATAGKIFHGYGPQPAHVNQILYSEPTPALADSYDRSGAVSNGGYWGSEGYIDEDDEFYDYKVAEYGVNFLSNYSDTDPFMLLLGFKHPHNGFEAPQKYYDLYDKSQIKVPETWVEGDLADVPAFAAQFMVNGNFNPETDFDGWQGTVEGYLAAISHMDAQVGRVMEALENSPYQDNTAIVLYSDHGFQLGDKEHFHKFTLWEESARAPLAISHPDLELGYVEDTPVSLIDIFQTMLDIAGVEGVERNVGQSLSGFWDDSKPQYEESPIFTHVYGSMSIRSGDYRFIQYVDGSEELYDLSTDPAQSYNLAHDPDYAADLNVLRADLFQSALENSAIVDAGEVVTGTNEDDYAIEQVGNVEIALGEGNDSYFTYGNEPIVVESEGEGTDHIYFSGSGQFDLPDNVEFGTHATPRARDLENGGHQWITLNGNDLDNFLRLHAANGIVNAGDGDDEVVAATWSTNDFMGEGGNDRLVSGNGRDILNGGSGRDYLISGKGNDINYGGEGNDVIYAGAGNDLLSGGVGSDWLDGGSGSDTVDYSDSAETVVVNLTNNTASGGDAEGDRLTSIEHVNGGFSADFLVGNELDNRLVGNGGNDDLAGRAGDDTFIGGAGSDYFRGGAGHDHVDYSSAIEGVSVDLSQSRGIGGEADGDRFFSIEKVTGSESADTFIGSNGQDILLARNGNDLLDGKGGNDRLDGGWGRDTIIGGDGFDYASYETSRSDEVVSLKDGAGSTRMSYLDELLEIEGIRGGSGNDEFEGDDLDNALLGEAGDDVLNGLDGADLINGGSGADEMDGGEGSDTLSYRGDFAGVNVSLQRGTATGGDANGDTFVNFEHIRDGFGSDRLEGDDEDNTIAFSSGNDSVFGGGGSDLFVLQPEHMVSMGYDWVADFSEAEGDQVMIEGQNLEIDRIHHHIGTRGDEVSTIVLSQSDNVYDILSLVKITGTHLEESDISILDDGEEDADDGWVTNWI